MADQETGVVLRQAEKTLPAHYYYDEDHYQRELNEIWYKNWIYVCRADDLAEPRSFRTLEIGDQSVIVLKGDDGEYRAFHNVCRHRGARLITEESGKLRNKFITCPYHAWSYHQDGALKATTTKSEACDFDFDDHALFTVAAINWKGFLYVNLAGKDAPSFEDCIMEGSPDISNWHPETLKVGHTLTKELKCNWKIFWENYNECLHCPGVHKSLVRMVPIYKRGKQDLMEYDDWRDHVGSDDPKLIGGMRKGAHTWTTDGQPIGKTFPDLTEEEIKTAYNFVDILPNTYLVCHVDYMRIVRIRPTGPETTELHAEWLFMPEVLDDPNTDLTPAIDFPTTVIMEDAEVAELNQKGVRSIAYKQGTLMPEEYSVLYFNNWVREQLNE